MTARTKRILSNLAIGVYVVSALLAVTFTISLASFPGGPASMGYAAIFLLLIPAASVAVLSIGVLGCWRETRKFVYFGAIAWPLPLVFTAFVAHALFLAK